MRDFIFWHDFQRFTYDYADRKFRDDSGQECGYLNFPRSVRKDFVRDAFRFSARCGERRYVAFGMNEFYDENLKPVLREELPPEVREALDKREFQWLEAYDC